MKIGIKRKTIIHCDMDAFYAGVEALDNPSLKGKPVIVGGNRERGVVSASSYEARRFGIHSAQPMAEAMRRCPNGIFLPVRMSRYKEVSCRVFDIFYRFTPVVEPLSIDEAFLDVTDSTRLFGDAEAIAKRIKTMVREEIGLTVSAGVAPLKFVAKIASDLNKPDGLIVVSPEQVKTFLEPLPIERLWGVGAASRKRLSILGVNTIGDLSRIPPEILEAKFGKQGMHLHLLSLGIDERDVETDHQTKSIGREETYSEDIMDVEEIRKELLSLAMKVAGRLRRNRCTGKVLTLKVKYYDFVLITRAMTLPAATDDGKYIFEHCCRLLEKTEAGKRPVRLLGISLSRLATPEEERQRSLFENDAAPEPRKKLNRALDIIEEKFGEDSLIPGTLLKK
ncbi:MAG: DNA polymerase IV [Deltaproteobacteria bacterium]|nr:DNA polymerase IV [Deltaproteobacteria bacterium]